MTTGPGEAIAALIPLIGSGGVTAIVIAWLGRKHQAQKRDDGGPPPAGIEAALSAARLSPHASAKDTELLANAISDVASSIDDNTAVLKFRLHLEGKSDEFTHWASGEFMKALAQRERVKAEAKRVAAGP